MKKTAALVLGLVAVAFLTAPASMAAEGNEKGKGEKIALDQVPAPVKAAAEKAVPGFTLTDAEKETKDGAVIYELKGTVGDKTYKVKVGADGTVIKSKEVKAKPK